MSIEAKGVTTGENKELIIGLLERAEVIEGPNFLRAIGRIGVIADALADLEAFTELKDEAMAGVSTGLHAPHLAKVTELPHIEPGPEANISDSNQAETVEHEQQQNESTLPDAGEAAEAVEPQSVDLISDVMLDAVADYFIEHPDEALGLSEVLVATGVELPYNMRKPFRTRVMRHLKDITGGTIAVQGQTRAQKYTFTPLRTHDSDIPSVSEATRDADSRVKIADPTQTKEAETPTPDTKKAAERDRYEALTNWGLMLNSVERKIMIGDSTALMSQNEIAMIMKLSDGKPIDFGDLREYLGSEGYRIEVTETNNAVIRLRKLLVDNGVGWRFEDYIDNGEKGISRMLKLSNAKQKEDDSRKN